MIWGKPAVSHRRIVQLMVPSIALLFAAASSAKDENAERLSMESLMGYYRTADKQTIDRAIQANRTRLTSAAAADPQRRVPATIFFREGVSAKRLAELATLNRLEVTYTDAKVPGNGTGETYTVLTRHPVGVPTELSARLRDSAEHTKPALSEATPAPANGDPRLREQASGVKTISNLLYFSAKVLGSQASLATVANAPETLTISIDGDSGGATHKPDDARRSNSIDPTIRPRLEQH